jgi:hypothetical protein
MGRGEDNQSVEWDMTRVTGSNFKLRRRSMLGRGIGRNQEHKIKKKYYR